MSPCVFSCAICGWSIYDDESLHHVTWINQFRIRKDPSTSLCSSTANRKPVYSSPDGIAVTGVGIYNEPYGAEWMAPLDFTER